MIGVFSFLNWKKNPLQSQRFPKRNVDLKQQKIRFTNLLNPFRKISGFISGETKCKEDVFLVIDYLFTIILSVIYPFHYAFAVAYASSDRMKRISMRVRVRVRVAEGEGEGG